MGNVPADTRSRLRAVPATATQDQPPANTCVRYTRAAAPLALLISLLPLGGCGDTVYCYFNYCPTTEDLAEDAAWEEFYQKVTDARSLALTVVNQTGVIVAVNVASGFQEPPCSYCDLPSDPVRRVAEVATLVGANGSATGEIKCGEFLVVSATAPYDVAPPLFYEFECGMSVPQGNVSFVGLGSTGESDLVGDIVSGTRCVVPVSDGFNCENDTLVITITGLGHDATFDPTTGDLLSPQTVPAGLISIGE